MEFNLSNTNIHLVFGDGGTNNGGSKVGIESSEIMPAISVPKRSVGDSVMTIDLSNSKYYAFTPEGLGEDFALIRKGDDRVIVRVRVHDYIERMWFGNDGMVMYASEDNYVLAPFVKFNDGVHGTTIEDCSFMSSVKKASILVGEDDFDKPFISFASLDENHLTIDDFGRCSAVAEAVDPIEVEMFASYTNDAFAEIEVTIFGAITSGMIKIHDQGSGYDPADPPEVLIFGGTGTGVRGTAVLTGGKVTSIDIDPLEGGTGYSDNTDENILKVIIQKRRPDDARGALTLTGDTISSGTISFVGDNYIEQPVVRLVGGGDGGSGGEVEAVMTGQTVTGLNVITAGTGYTKAPQVVIKRLEERTTVTIKESLKTLQQPILKKIKSLTASNTNLPKTNLLLLADGFTNENDFNKVVKDIEAYMFSEVHEPYGALRGSMDVYSAFIPSVTDGISIVTGLMDGGVMAESDALNYRNGTIMPTIPIVDGIDREGIIPPTTPYSLEELVNIVGLPYHGAPTAHGAAQTFWNSGQYSGFNPNKVDTYLFNAWKVMIPTILPQLKSSTFGYSFGTPFNGTVFSQLTADLPYGSWYRRGATRAAIADKRRVSKGGAAAFLNRFILSLRYEDITDPDYTVSVGWSLAGSDKGLVCMVLNSEQYGGAKQGNAFASSLGDETDVPMKSLVTYPDKYEVKVFPTDRNLADAARTFAHEMGHCKKFGLLDEYENTDGNLTNSPVSFKDLREVEASANSTTLRKVVNNGSLLADKDIDPGLIKWNWHRVELASVIIEAAVNEGATDVKIKVEVPTAKLWTAAMGDSRNVILTTREINPDNAFLEVKTLGDVKGLVITNINEATGIITLEGEQLDDPLDFPTGSFLYLPLREGGAITNVEVVVAGAGYTKNPKIEVIGDGKKGKIKVVELVGEALDETKIEIKSGGKGYTKDPLLEVKSSGKDEPTVVAKLKATITPENTGILYFKIKKGGSGYTTVPDVEIVGGKLNGTSPTGPDEALATAVLSNAIVTGVTLTTGGSGYIPEIITELTGGGGIGGEISVSASNGVIHERNVEIKNPGVGYTSAPTFTVTGGTTAPIINLTVTPNGWIDGFEVVDGGAGFDERSPRAIYLKPIHPVGKGARIRAIMKDDSFPIMDQGTFKEFIIEQPGHGYTEIGLTFGFDDKTPQAVHLTRPSFTLSPSNFDIVTGSFANLLIGDLDSNSIVYPDIHLPLEVIITDKDGVDMGAEIKPVVNDAGVIATLDFIEAGEGYGTGVPPYKVEILGGTMSDEDPAHKATASIAITKTVLKVIIDPAASGKGYLKIPEVQITGGGGTGAVVVAELDYFSRLIDRNVFKHLESSKTAFGEKNGGECDTANEDALEVVKPEGVLFFDYPLYKPYTVGIYEGGATWNCKTYRPTGISMMRSKSSKIQEVVQDISGDNNERKIIYHRFNYPSRYYMVSKVNPALLPRIDDDIQREYNTLKK
ncbi:MAG: hypothetical protein ACI8ZM_003790 [Crocinitomix sp.]|jgi:hypothetical protein